MNKIEKLLSMINIINEGSDSAGLVKTSKGFVFYGDIANPAKPRRPEYIPVQLIVNNPDGSELSDDEARKSYNRIKRNKAPRLFPVPRFFKSEQEARKTAVLYGIKDIKVSAAKKAPSSGIKLNLGSQVRYMFGLTKAFPLFDPEVFSKEKRDKISWVVLVNLDDTLILMKNNKEYWEVSADEVLGTSPFIITLRSCIENQSSKIMKHLDDWIKKTDYYLQKAAKWKEKVLSGDK